MGWLYYICYLRNTYDYKYASYEIITTESGLKDKNNVISKVLYNYDY